MNWNEIENLINNFRDRFEADEPYPGHLASFEAKLKQRSPKTYFFRNKNSWARIAASISILVITACVSYLIYDRSQPNKNITQTTSELNETEMYYTKQIRKGMDQIRSLKISDQKQKTAIISDLSNMDKNYEQLKSDLKNNPDDERLIHAIVTHYQVKLEAIDQVINSISFNQNNLKPQGHEQNL